jgi:hypothetical protein
MANVHLKSNIPIGAKVEISLKGFVLKKHFGIQTPSIHKCGRVSGLTFPSGFFTLGTKVPQFFKCL